MKSRRHFLKTTGLGMAAALLHSATGARAQGVSSPTAPQPNAGGIKLGLASYTVRKFDYDKVLGWMKRLGLQRLTLKDSHLPLNATDEQIRRAIDKAKAEGITVYGCGTVYMKTPAEVERSFEYARVAGMEMIIGAPNEDLLPLVEKKVKETGILVAIHNHGPDNPLYPSPLDAYALIKGMDRRMGLCMDIGHTQRLGQNPSDVFKATFDRIFDVHIKDVSGSSKAGKTIEMGRGVIDIVGFLKTVVALKYAHTLNFEFEKDSDDPMLGVAESIGYTRGVLKALGA